jgi:hypothetical protein
MTACAVARTTGGVVVVTTVVPAPVPTGTVVVPVAVVTSTVACALTSTLIARLGLGIVSTPALEATVGALRTVERFVNTNNSPVEPAQCVRFRWHSTGEKNSEVSSLLLVVHRVQRGIRLSISSKTDKAEPTTAQSRTVLDNNLS